MPFSIMAKITFVGQSALIIAREAANGLWLHVMFLSSCCQGPTHMPDIEEALDMDTFPAQGVIPPAPPPPPLVSL